MTPNMVADIGGTNARFARLDANDQPGDPVTLGVAEHASFAAAFKQACMQLAGPPVEHLAMAFAAPITGDRLALTNAGWSFSVSASRRELALRTLLVLNDFTALAWSLPRLHGTELRRIGGGQAAPDAARALIGPGTGLGVSGLLPTAEGGWTALSGEGGHVSLAPADAREAAIVAWAWRHHGHVSAERLISGTGLPLLHAAVGAVDGFVVPSAQEAPDASSPSAAIITARALEGDAHARATLETFCALLGGTAGNLALTLGARGGVYLGGGIAPRIADFLAGSAFRERFEAKGRFAQYLSTIPVWLIDATEPTLRGAAHALENWRASEDNH